MDHNCLHEEQIQGQSRAIERLGAELSYKKERLDEIKEDNKRMETKIDDIKDCMNKLVVKSKTDDDKLDKRLIAIETEQKVIKEQSNKNKSDFNTRLVVITIILGLLQFYFAYLR